MKTTRDGWGHGVPLARVRGTCAHPPRWTREAFLWTTPCHHGCRQAAPQYLLVSTRSLTVRRIAGAVCADMCLPLSSSCSLLLIAPVLWADYARRCWTAELGIQNFSQRDSCGSRTVRACLFCPPVCLLSPYAIFLSRHPVCSSAFIVFLRLQNRTRRCCFVSAI